MKNKDFIAELKQHGINSIDDLPSGYDYTIMDKKLVLKLKKNSICANMQDNASAFESWAIILWHHCSKMINTVLIDWEEFEGKDKHFNRFVYRLTKFVQSYEWVSTIKPIPTMPQKLFCNAPNTPAAQKDAHEIGSERWIECNFVEKNTNNYDTIDHQLPVGLFDGVVSEDTHFTPGNRSCIDIWSIKGEELNIFELKKPGNCLLGIISELMFYTNVVNDLLSHNILFDENYLKKRKSVTNNYRNFARFYDIYSGSKTISHINAILLADELHPQINDEILKIINDSPRHKQCNITYRIAKP